MQVTLYIDVELLKEQIDTLSTNEKHDYNDEVYNGIIGMLCDIEMNLRDNGELTLKASKAEEKPTKCTMDDFDKRHLDGWLDFYCVDDDQKDSLRKKIVAFVNEHPDVLKRNLSWPEIKDLTERDLWT